MSNVQWGFPLVGWLGTWLRSGTVSSGRLLGLYWWALLLFLLLTLSRGSNQSPPILVVNSTNPQFLLRQPCIYLRALTPMWVEWVTVVPHGVTVQERAPLGHPALHHSKWLEVSYARQRHTHSQLTAGAFRVANCEPNTYLRNTFPTAQRPPYEGYCLARRTLEKICSLHLFVSPSYPSNALTLKTKYTR